MSMGNKTAGHRVLLIMPKFCNFEDYTTLALEKLGYEVAFIENKSLAFDYHGTRSKAKNLRRLYFLLFRPHIHYINRQFEKIENGKFDILLSINGFIICHYLFKKLKKQNAQIYSIMYLWDSFSMYSWEKECNLFDVVYSFDHKDSVIHGFKYHPGFFIENNIKSGECCHDLTFIGKFSPERFRILENIINEISGFGVNTFFKVLPDYRNSLHARWFYLFLKVIRIKSRWINDYLLNYEVIEGKLQRDYFIRERINYEDVQKEIVLSNVILDIPYSGQTGYTHRLIEALANGKKLITTNRNILKEIFFNPDQICIIESEHPVIDCNWIMRKGEFQRNGYFTGLEVTAWLKSILNRAIA
jgi:hypothetical protein